MKFIDFVKKQYPDIELHPYQRIMINKLMEESTPRAKLRNQHNSKSQRIASLNKMIKEGSIKMSAATGTKASIIIVDDPIKESEDYLSFCRKEQTILKNWGTK